MNERKHTPGPWKCNRGHHGWSVDKTAEKGVCTIWDNSDGSGIEEHQANAQLIAAAPDLLEACEAYLRAMDEYGHPDKTDRLMRKAIDKATTQR